MKSRKHVSLVDTRSPIKRSWTRIISAIHDPQKAMTFIGCLDGYLAGNSCLAPTSFSRKPALHGRRRWIMSISSTTGYETPSSACTIRPDEIGADGFSSLSHSLGPVKLAETKFRQSGGGGVRFEERGGGFLLLGSRTPQNPLLMLNTLSSVSVRKSRIHYLCDPQWFRDTASRGPTTIVAPESQSRTCPTDHDSIGYPRMSASGESSTTMHQLLHASGSHQSRRLMTPNSIGYPRMSASGESSTTMHQLLHASGSHPIPPPDDPKTNQYNQDLGLIHSTNGNHLKSPNEGSSIDHQVTIYLHAQNITMFPTNETWYFASQILVSNSGGLILISTAQLTRNMFRIHSDY
ncbi:hypothetical protein F511_28474 [Dorcoceras hygrometricum]|uniref:Uncharacterized protein n=1 Tax=Dorcoceras hygrometricum TaxID=472368 RepID=A0A2Z7B0B7_9LAMI|nr:hypothetical protein F511_28474 [Dorcoceras hygrometricum]